MRRLIASWRSHVVESLAQSGPGPEHIEHFSPLVNVILPAGRDGPHSFAVTIVLREVPLPLSGLQCQILP